jgi:hypothetical protein
LRFFYFPPNFSSNALNTFLTSFDACTSLLILSFFFLIFSLFFFLWIFTLFPFFFLFVFRYEQKSGFRVLSIGSADMMGRRPTMEDKIQIVRNFCNHPDWELFCVFDGHAGATAAEFIAEHLPGVLEHKLRQFAADGTTLEGFKTIEEILTASFREANLEVPNNSKNTKRIEIILTTNISFER